jgi:hypothetical protein
MRRPAIRTLVLTLVLLSGPGAAGGAGIGISPEAEAAFRSFLAADCGVGADGSAGEALLEHAEQLEPGLRRVLIGGPDDALRTENLQFLEAQWDRREAFLSTNPQLGLSPDHLFAVQSAGRQEYLEQGEARFAQGCRERAVLGLATIGSPTALQTLSELADELDGELAGLIRAALEAANSARSARPGRLHEARSGTSRPTR